MSRWQVRIADQSYNIGMRHLVLLLSAWLSLSWFAAGQAQDKSSGQPGENQPPPRSERSREAGESSSRDTRIDLSPPKNDAKDHPNSGASVAGSNEDLPDADDSQESGDVQEFHPFNPHRALKDIEVGDFYFKKKNYGAALDRYREALLYKPNDAVANFRMAQSLDKLARLEEAAQHYQEYLRILPHGPLAEEARKALEKMKTAGSSDKDQPRPQ